MTQATTIGSSSVDIRAFYNGVEINSQDKWDAGVVKIWSGEAGHQLRQVHFGENRNFHNYRGFREFDDPNSSPVNIVLSSVFRPLSGSIVAGVITTGEPDRYEGKGYAFDGIIEPFTIRPKTVLYSITSPLDAHTNEGALMGGNENDVSASDSVVSAYTVFNGKSMRAGVFVDSSPKYSQASLNPLHGYTTNVPSGNPFVDTRYVANFITSSNGGPGMQAAMSLMSGSTDKFLRLKEVSATSGFVYDSVAGVGTDSLAFGGRLF